MTSLPVVARCVSETEWRSGLIADSRHQSGSRGIAGTAPAELRAPVQTEAASHQTLTLSICLMMIVGVIIADELTTTTATLRS